MAHLLAEGLRFRHEDTPIHRLDPRVKLLISIALFSISLLTTDLYQLAIAFCAIAVPAALAKSLRRLGKVMSVSLTFAAFIFVINLVFSYGLYRSATLTLRFMAIVASTSLFFVTTSPDELEYVMRWFRLPRDFVFAFVTAVRFVPVLMLDLTQIIDAQKSRGLEMDKGGPAKRLRNLIPVLIPLIVNALVRSGELAEAMESRGYGAVKNPTSLYALHLKSRDYAALLVTVAVWAGVLLCFRVV
ncbi:MAG TPA: energy-coupling factor transporter transmembrane component T [Conexivisphaerales archaeon]|nr:energy-coupling factor transporter transmembrane component T [Conexivisphaerales archaeon]